MPSEGGTIKLSDDTTSDGVSVKSGTNVILDLNGKTLTLDGQMAGSSGTKTNGFQFLKDSNVYIKNGTITSNDAKIIIQNYSNLTLDGVIINGTAKTQYVVSNNYGNTVFKNGTELHAPSGVAFDAYYGMSATYDDGVTVTIEDTSVVIDGPVEFGKAKRATESKFIENAHIYAPQNGYNYPVAEGYEWVDNLDDNVLEMMVKTVTPTPTPIEDDGDDIVDDEF